MKPTLSHFLLCSFSLLLAVACSQNHSPELKRALELAGPNRKELKSVLSHYSRDRADSLKYLAACFLIENMQWHYGKRVHPDPALWNLFLLEDSLVKSSLLHPGAKTLQALHGYRDGAKRILVNQAVMRSDSGRDYHSDLLTLDAPFLIETIEQAFQTRELEWCRELSFDDFCNYVLPYRLNNEPVFPVRERLQRHFMQWYHADSLERDPLKVAFSLTDYVRLFNWDWADNSAAKPDLGFYNLLYWRNSRMDCPHLVAVMGSILRSIGLPAADLFTPRWGDTDLGHSWCYFPVGSGKPYLFTAFHTRPGAALGPHPPERGTKLFVRTFAPQPNTPWFLREPDEPVPATFQTPCIRDVTSLFLPSHSLEVPLIIEPPEKSRLCWFSVFIRGNWVPVGWGVIDHERNTARFEQVPERLTGVASYYDGQRVIPCSQLMRIGPGGAQHITPDTTKTTLSLTRKFPVKTRLQYFNAQIIGTTIEGANQADFSDAVTLAVVSDTLKPFFQDLVISHPDDYRYYRILASSSHLHMAGMELLTGEQLPGTELATPLPVFNKNNIGQKKHYRFRGEIIGENTDSTAFDGDMLTYNNEKWVGLDLGKPQKVTRARIAPRNAHNGIVPGDRYELLYWDGQWLSAGIREASYHFIEFDGVPLNTLYWLRNLDHGKEEQPFYYAHGRQIFSNQPAWTDYGNEE